LIAQEHTARISETGVFLTPTGRSFIFADIVEFAWNASTRGRGGRSSVARREIHRSRACSGCRLPPARADRRARQLPLCLAMDHPAFCSRRQHFSDRQWAAIRPHHVPRFRAQRLSNPAQGGRVSPRQRMTLPGSGHIHLRTPPQSALIVLGRHLHGVVAPHGTARPVPRLDILGKYARSLNLKKIVS
jgi:hypothetical protein